MEDAITCLADAGSGTATSLVRGCFSREDSQRFQKWFPCYLICVECFPSMLAVKLLEVYVNESELRYEAVQLLCFSLSLSPYLSPHALVELKPLILLCLQEQSKRQFSEIEPEVNYLTKIVNSVTSLVFSYNLQWPELAECICNLANSVPSLALQIFLDLPPSLGFDFIRQLRFCNGLYQEAKLRLTFSASYQTEEVTNAFCTLVYIGVQLYGAYMEPDVSPIMDAISHATRLLLDLGQTDTVILAIEELSSILTKSFGAYGGSSNKQKKFLVSFACVMISVDLPIAVQMCLFKLFEDLFVSYQ